MSHPNLRYKSQKDYWSDHCKTFVKVYAFLVLLFGWIFESTVFGTFFWSLIVGLFVCGGGVYLTRENRLSDQEILTRIMSGAWAKWK